MAPTLDLLAVGRMQAPTMGATTACESAADARELLKFQRFDLILSRDIAALTDRTLASAAPVLTPEGLTQARLEAVVTGWIGPVDPSLAEMAAGYTERLATRIQTIEAASLAGDLPVLARLGHQIAGTAALYGLPGVGRECDMLCTAAREGRTQACAWQVARIGRVLRASLERLRAIG